MSREDLFSGMVNKHSDEVHRYNDQDYVKGQPNTRNVKKRDRIKNSTASMSKKTAGKKFTGKKAALAAAALLIAGGVFAERYMGNQEGKRTIIDQSVSMANNSGAKEYISALQELGVKISEEEFKQNPKENYQNIWEKELDETKQILGTKLGIDDYKQIKIQSDKNETLVITENKVINAKELDKETQAIVNELVKNQKQDSDKDATYNDYKEVYYDTYNTIAAQQTDSERE